MSLDPNLMLVAAAVVGASTLLLLLLWLGSAVRAERLAARLDALEQGLAQLRAATGAATGISVKAGERVRRLDQVCTQMTERLGQLELRGDGRPYDQAIALVRRGADAERLIRNFGLSRGEADLMTRLHRRRAG